MRSAYALGRVCVFAALVLWAGAGMADTPGFSDDGRARGPFQENWLAGLPDDTRLSELSIPGTHASAARRAGEPFGAYGVAQALSLSDQLRLGIRALDLPVRLAANGRLYVHHGPTPQNLPLANALRQIQGFLKRHRGEFVLVALSHRPSVGAFDRYRDPGDAAVRRALDGYLSDPRFAGLFRRGGPADPTLGSVRGRIALLDDPMLPAGLGIRARATGPRLSLLDGDPEAALDRHWARLEAALGQGAGRSPRGSVPLTSLAGTGLAAQWGGRDVWAAMRAIEAGEVPAPLDPRAVARDVNARALAALGTRLTGPLGVVLMDFPSGALATRIVGLNRAFDWGLAAPRALADIDGDGRADFCRAVRRGGGAALRCDLAGEGGFDGAVALGIGPGAHAFQAVADVTGDGRADFCRLEDAKRPARLACRTDLARPGGAGPRAVLGGLWLAEAPASGADAPRRWLADVTGDGRADLCALTREDGQAALACWAMGQTGRAALAKTTPLDPGRPGNRWFADVNGDGAADFCRVVGRKPAGYLRCELADAARFPSAITAHVRMGHREGFYRFRAFADVDGDGRADYCRVVGRPPRPKLSCALSDGEAIKDAFYQPIDIGDPGYRFLADVNADGVAEFCRRLGTGVQDFACLDFQRGGVPRETFRLLAPAAAEVRR